MVTGKTSVFVFRPLTLRSANNSLLPLLRDSMSLGQRYLHVRRMDKYKPGPADGDLEQIASAYGEAAISTRERLGHCWLLEGGPWSELVACWRSVPASMCPRYGLERSQVM